LKAALGSLVARQGLAFFYSGGIQKQNFLRDSSGPVGLALAAVPTGHPVSLQVVLVRSTGSIMEACNTMEFNRTITKIRKMDFFIVFLKRF
jgi:hypothetical protein